MAGHASCAHWLHFRTGIDLGAAREKVRAARALESLPRVSDAMSRGELSFSKVRALTRLDGFLDDEQEDVLVDFARQVTAAELEKRVRGWKLGNRLEEAERERRRHASRCLSVFPGDDGMYVIQGRLDPEVGALVMRALEAAAHALHRPGEEWAPEGGSRGPKTREVTPRQRRADALGLLAERALGMGFGAEGSGRAGCGEGEEAAEGRTTEAGPTAAGNVGKVALREVSAGTVSQGNVTEPLSGTRAHRYQVLLHVDPATLQSHGEPGISHLEDGTRVSAATSRRLCCDAGVVEVSSKVGEVAGRVVDVPGKRKTGNQTLNIGCRTRTIPPALRRALEVRDGGCRFPGCGLRFTEAHHITHWADGGETRLDNLILLCRHHHRALHEEGFRVRLRSDGTPRFSDRTGWPLPDIAPPTPALSEDPIQSLRRKNRARGARLDEWTASSHWKRSGDIPWSVEARVREVVER